MRGHYTTTGQHSYAYEKGPLLLEFVTYRYMGLMCIVRSIVLANACCELYVRSGWQTLKPLIVSSNAGLCLKHCFAPRITYSQFNISTESLTQPEHNLYIKMLVIRTTGPRNRYHPYPRRNPIELQHHEHNDDWAWAYFEFPTSSKKWTDICGRDYLFSNWYREA
ncbi:hypothetical protein C8R42DRAFT_645613 [Lentinula raphanica]|nr:hypothetical protein C8R42DRAFT_645613 [Lentinula raphanica]